MKELTKTTTLTVTQEKPVTTPITETSASTKEVISTEPSLGYGIGGWVAIAGIAIAFALLRRK